MTAEMERIKRKIVIGCAPVLFHVKAGATILLQLGEERTFYGIMEDWDTEYRLLYEDDRSVLFLVFQARLLRRQLEEEENRALLHRFGYEGTEPAACLLRLGTRYRQYRRGAGEFPHELGVFLGFPAEDIGEFLKRGGQEYLFCGYWKVYRHPEKAKRQFACFDRAKEIAAGFFPDFQAGKALNNVPFHRL